jgi:DNA-binding MarR family transcriptional regulator
MHQVIHRLERAGLIVRGRHPRHRRRPASLTPEGRHVVAVCEVAAADFETRMLQGFGPAERDRFLTMISSAARNLRLSEERHSSLEKEEKEEGERAPIILGLE